MAMSQEDARGRVVTAYTSDAFVQFAVWVRQTQKHMQNVYIEVCSAFSLPLEEDRDDAEAVLRALVAGNGEELHCKRHGGPTQQL